jgi:hypothetical protein
VVADRVLGAGHPLDPLHSAGVAHVGDGRDADLLGLGGDGHLDVDDPGAGDLVEPADPERRDGVRVERECARPGRVTCGGHRFEPWPAGAADRDRSVLRTGGDGQQGRVHGTLEADVEVRHRAGLDRGAGAQVTTHVDQADTQAVRRPVVPMPGVVPVQCHR